MRSSSVSGCDIYNNIAYELVRRRFGMHSLFFLLNIDYLNQIGTYVYNIGLALLGDFIHAFSLERNVSYGY